MSTRGRRAPPRPVPIRHVAPDFPLWLNAMALQCSPQTLRPRDSTVLSTLVTEVGCYLARMVLWMGVPPAGSPAAFSWSGNKAE
jgi:hypothetical protein